MRDEQDDVFFYMFYHEGIFEYLIMRVYLWKMHNYYVDGCCLYYLNHLALILNCSIFGSYILKKCLFHF